MKMKRMIAFAASIVMIATVTTACGSNDSGKSGNKTPHTTYSNEQINNMSDDELEKALENAAKEIEMSEGATEQSPVEEDEGIDLWADVDITVSGAEDFAMIKVEYVGDNQIIKDNVEFSAISVKEVGPVYVSGFKNGDENIVCAWYDEEALETLGVKLKKNINNIESAEIRRTFSKKGADPKYITIEGLGDHITFSEDTDVTPYINAVDDIVETIKKAAEYNEYNGDWEWVKESDMQPKEIYLVTNSSNNVKISFEKQDGTEFWFTCRDLNAYHTDGTLCINEWKECYVTRLIAPKEHHYCASEELVKVI